AEKDRMDKARADKVGRNSGENPSTEEGEMKRKEMSNDPTPVPVRATVVEGEKIGIVAGGGEQTVASRGEVRSLKVYEGRMEGKTNHLTKVADRAKIDEERAKDLHDRTTQLLDQARQVEGGAKLLGQIQKLVECTKQIHTSAEETSKRAGRSVEACKTLATNVKARYEPIYQAVVDSDETKPAELSFYADRGVTRG
ncbi:hypothetical protein ABT282_31130, partial [Streptomyces sp. NPDC000927]|uniref:hypothetical protein n=1 Tax=Streptomyces sp. NPDC000927 TaxID=3154371 RepID=UPI0033250B85